MNTSTVAQQLSDLAPALLSPSVGRRDEVLDNFVWQQVRLTSPLVDIEGLSKVRNFLQAEAIYREGEVDISKIEWDEGLRLATITFTQMVTVPLLKLLRLKIIDTKTTLHLRPSREKQDNVEKDDEGQPTLWWIDHISIELITSNPLVISPILSVVLPSFGQLLLRTHSLHSRLQAKASQLPALTSSITRAVTKLTFHPIENGPVVLAVFALFWIGLAQSVVDFWQRKVVKDKGLLMKLDLSTNVEPAKKPKKNIDPMSPLNLLNNPVPGESYAAAVKHQVYTNGSGSSNQTTNTDNDKAPDASAASSAFKADKKETIDGNSGDTTPEAAKPENLQNNPVPGESYAAAADPNIDTISTTVDTEESPEIEAAESRSCPP
ncbi:hypothetical protein [Phaffia rhodozyma]|uniref:Uncharacterized protein n=1 Tax=Phaffia rhodozyma TaxID=264483 RepID=A0A0F7SHA0_PHARH|nr:hypothetical protein [Phaffia rhodozyma]